MSCKCDIDNLRITNATLVQGTSATIIVAPTALEHGDLFRLRYCVKFQDATGAEVLFITVGATTYPVLDKLGNPVTIGRLRRRELLCLRFSNITSAAPVVVPHFTLLSKIYCQTIITPEIEAAAGE